MEDSEILDTSLENEPAEKMFSGFSTPDKNVVLEAPEQDQELRTERDDQLQRKMNGKPILYHDATSVLYMDSGFRHKELCTGPTLNLGDACGFSCSYCYVESMMLKNSSIQDTLGDASHQNVVMRRRNALQVLEAQLKRSKAKRAPHVVYSSTTVDIAANKELMRETAAACMLILEATVWDIRLLTKSNLLPEFVTLIRDKYHRRLILGVSTGTFDDALARIIEKGTAPVSKRVESLLWLQDNGFRTFAMVCPSLPQEDYDAFAREAAESLRYDRCEHVWAEVMNVRGESFTRTLAFLDGAGLIKERDLLAKVCGPDCHGAWEEYSRATFEAHKKFVPQGKLRFLQYVNRDKDLPYWKEQEPHGAIILGTAHKRAAKKAAPAVATATVEVEGTAKIRELLESVRANEVKLKCRVMSGLAQWVEKVIKIGKFFSTQKDALPHGKYLTWLTTNFAIDRKTANNYVAVYTQREPVLAALRLGNVPHMKAAYDLARKANRALEAPRPAQAVTVTDAPVTETAIERLEDDEAVGNAEGEPTVEAEVEVVDKQLDPVLVVCAPEEVVGDLIELLADYETQFPHQVIRADGDIRLNELFSQRLAAKAA